MSKTIKLLGCDMETTTSSGRVFKVAVNLSTEEFTLTDSNGSYSFQGCLPKGDERIEDSAVAEAVTKVRRFIMHNA